MTVNKLTYPAKENAVQEKINEIIDNLGGGSSYTAGTGISISNDVISVTTPTLVNNSTIGLAILGTGSSSGASTAIGQNATASGMFSIAINNNATTTTASGMYALAIGAGASATNTCSTSIGYSASATSSYAIQLGYGTNSEANSFYVGTSSSNNWKMLGNDGKIPAARLTVMTGADGTNAGSLGAVPAPTATDNTKFLRGDGTWATAGGGGSSRNVGEIVQSTIPLTDAGLHLLDGSLLLGGGIYDEFVQYVAGLVSSYPDLFVTEASWQAAVSANGVCGKFVYDSSGDGSVRLPKITGIIEGTTSVSALGDLVAAGLPNITGKVGQYDSGSNILDTVSGAFFAETDSGKSGGYAAWSTGTNYKEKFDASRSSSIYGNSSTVQPQTIKQLVYMVIANSTKTQVEVDIDQVATDLNGKADTDLGNIVSGSFENVVAQALASGKATVVSWVMPDFTAGVSKSTETIYQADKDGYIQFYGRQTSNGNNCSNIEFCLDNSFASGTTIRVSGDYINNGSGSTTATLIPISKGVYYRASNVGTTNEYVFYPCKGA